MLDEIEELIKPGNKVRVFYNNGNINNEIRHIRAIVDNDQVVYRVWNKHKRRWVYYVEWVVKFQILYKYHHLKKC